jgi:hypothetical protein
VGDPVSAAVLCTIVELSIKSIHCVVVDVATGWDDGIDEPVGVVAKCNID